MYLCCNMDSENFKRNLFACLLNGLTIPPPFSFNLLHMLMPGDKKTAKPTINPTLNFETNKNRAKTKEQKRREKEWYDVYTIYFSDCMFIFSYNVSKHAIQNLVPLHPSF